MWDSLPENQRAPIHRLGLVQATLERKGVLVPGHAFCGVRVHLYAYLEG